MRGRRPKFDRGEALSAAMKVFWRKGYGSASLSDLTTSMGINKPSLYAAFGNKEALLIEAVRHYVDQYVMPLQALLDDPTVSPRERLRAYVLATVANQTDSSLPGGCLIASCSSESKGDVIPAKAREALAATGMSSTGVLEQFFASARKASMIDTSLSDADLANYVFTMLHGCASMARAGKSREELSRIVDIGLEGLPLPR